ncbi:hypothetical protein QMX33_002992 [Yersinia ruckeri]|nr:hypothetical protein [Yersinia ruckeri]EKN4202802.1 hypothetical protein [Yersinia ruckeri]EKN4727217.1 hypothetical protein [Yersinia ruckeri]ELV7521795.1 hypothetical protein [Yersinia ruckeri]
MLRANAPFRPTPQVRRSQPAQPTLSSPTLSTTLSGINPGGADATLPANCVISPGNVCSQHGGIKNTLDSDCHDNFRHAIGGEIAEKYHQYAIGGKIAEKYQQYPSTISASCVSNVVHMGNKNGIKMIERLYSFASEDTKVELKKEIQSFAKALTDKASRKKSERRDKDINKLINTFSVHLIDKVIGNDLDGFKGHYEKTMVDPQCIKMMAPFIASEQLTTPLDSSLFNRHNMQTRQANMESCLNNVKSFEGKGKARGAYITDMLNLMQQIESKASFINSFSRTSVEPAMLQQSHDDVDSIMPFPRSTLPLSGISSQPQNHPFSGTDGVKDPNRDIPAGSGESTTITYNDHSTVNNIYIEGNTVEPAGSPLNREGSHKLDALGDMLNSLTDKIRDLYQKIDSLSAGSENPVLKQSVAAMKPENMEPHKTNHTDGVISATRLSSSGGIVSEAPVLSAPVTFSNPASAVAEHRINTQSTVARSATEPSSRVYRTEMTINLESVSQKTMSQTGRVLPLAAPVKMMVESTTLPALSESEAKNTDNQPLGLSAQLAEAAAEVIKATSEMLSAAEPGFTSAKNIESNVLPLSEPVKMMAESMPLPTLLQSEAKNIDSQPSTLSARLFEAATGVIKATGEMIDAAEPRPVSAKEAPGLAADNVREKVTLRHREFEKPVEEKAPLEFQVLASQMKARRESMGNTGNAAGSPLRNVSLSALGKSSTAENTLGLDRTNISVAEFQLKSGELSSTDEVKEVKAQGSLLKNISRNASAPARSWPTVETDNRVLLTERGALRKSIPK